MKRLLLFLTFALLSIVSFSQGSLEPAVTSWETIRDETVRGANTAARVGNAGLDVVSGVRDTLLNFALTDDVDDALDFKLDIEYRSDTTGIDNIVIDGKRTFYSLPDGVEYSIFNSANFYIDNFFNRSFPALEVAVQFAYVSSDGFMGYEEHIYSRTSEDDSWTDWEELSPDVDLSNYYTKSQTQSLISDSLVSKDVTVDKYIEVGAGTFFFTSDSLITDAVGAGANFSELNAGNTFIADIVIDDTAFDTIQHVYYLDSIVGAKAFVTILSDVKDAIRIKVDSGSNAGYYYASGFDANDFITLSKIIVDDSLSLYSKTTEVKQLISDSIAANLSICAIVDYAKVEFNSSSVSTKTWSATSTPTRQNLYEISSYNITVDGDTITIGSSMTYDISIDIQFTSSTSNDRTHEVVVQKTDGTVLLRKGATTPGGGSGRSWTVAGSKHGLTLSAGDVIEVLVSASSSASFTIPENDLGYCIDLTIHESTCNQ